MAVGTLQQNKDKSSKKVIFSLMTRPLPPPLLMARPLKEELFLPLKHEQENYISAKKM